MSHALSELPEEKWQRVMGFIEGMSARKDIEEPSSA